MTTKYPFDATYKLTLSVGYVGADQEENYSPSEDYDQEAWDAFTDDEKVNFLTDKAQEELEGHVEYSFEIVK